MRPVNLLPPEERRGDRAGSKGAGSLSYIVVGALAAGLLFVTAFALTGKQISDRTTEVSNLEQEEAAAQERAQRLQAFADFRGMRESRAAAVTSLAQSRFDWQRVLRELSIVIPSDAWLITATGTASPAVQMENGAQLANRAEVAGPALELVGCAAGQDSVAGFVAALEDVDGVTRVGVVKSELPDESSVDAGAGGAGPDECRTRDFIAKFELVVAFDEVPVPAAAGVIPPALPSTTPATAAGAVPEQQAAQQSVSDQTAEAQQASDSVGGGLK
ncbi:MAG: hypothetical protein EXQ70_10760 [Solirubrobacterales bacterium]|nr:hypothetical protein [Solirubrobacterales bacterium]